MDNRNHPDSEEIRRFMQNKIYDYILLKGQPHSRNVAQQRMIDFSKFLDKTMFNAAPSFDEYRNAHTFEVRLLYYLKQVRHYKRNQMLVQHENSTPGSASQLTSGMGSASQLTGGMGSANGDQQPAASVFPTTSGSSNMGSSMDGGEGTSSQMMQVKEEKEEN